MKYLIFFFGLTLCAMATAQVRVPDFTYGGSRYTGLTATLIDTDTVELRTAAGQTTRLRWGLTPGDVQKALAPARDGLLAKVPPAPPKAPTWRVVPEAQYGIKVRYEPPEALADKERNKLEALKVPAAEWDAKLQGLPKGGYLYVVMNRSSIEGANPRWFTFIVEADGKEILREKGERKVPNTPGADGQWWSSHLMVLPAFTGKLNLRVVDALTNNSAYDFIVEKQ